MTQVGSSYVAWAKRRPSLPFDLAVSNVLACSLDDLPGARDALTLEGSSEHGYPPLVDAIAARYGVRRDSVSTAAGTTGANLQVFAALLQPGDDVLIEQPGYEPLAAAVRLVGGRPVNFDRGAGAGFALDPDRVRRAMTHRTRLIVVTNLHNPSGVLADSTVLAQIGRSAEAAGARVLVDEVYLDAAAARAVSAATLGPVFVVTSSLTKAYGLGSLRCGWVVADPAVAEAVRRARDLLDSAGSIVAERLGALAFARLEQLSARGTAHLALNRPVVDAFFASRDDLDVVSPAAGATVAFPRVKDGGDASGLADALAAAGVAIVPGHFFGSAAHFRLGWGGPGESVRRGLEILARVLDGRRLPARA